MVLSRTFVECVITEYGITHPDDRDALRAEAAQLM
jgi:hypothetical protein